MDGPDHPQPSYARTTPGRTPDDGPPLLSFFPVAEVTLIKLVRERDRHRWALPQPPLLSLSLSIVCLIGGGPSACSSSSSSDDDERLSLQVGRARRPRSLTIRSQQAGRIRSHRAGRTCTCSPLLSGVTMIRRMYCTHRDRSVRVCTAYRIAESGPRGPPHGEAQCSTL